MDGVEGLREGRYVEYIWIRTVCEAQKLSYQRIRTLAALVLLSEISVSPTEADDWNVSTTILSGECPRNARGK